MYRSNRETIEPIKIEKIIKKIFKLKKHFLKFFQTSSGSSKKRDTIRALNSVKEIREHDIPFYEDI